MIEKYIITSAVNNSKVFEKGLKTLENYTEHQNATLIILPLRYNPARLTQDEIKYDDKLSIYLQYTNFTIDDRFTVLPEVNISPTAIKPLQGLASLGNESHTLVGSPRMHLDTIPTIDIYNPKFIMTTGCITEENYTVSKLGAKADFHHTYGAVIVEVDKKSNEIHFRQITIDDEGNFNDIDTKYTNNEIYKEEAEAIAFGDIHIPFIAKVVEDKGFFGENSLLHLCKPNKVILHDILDFYSKSHHNEKDILRKHIISNGGLNPIKEVDETLEFIRRLIYLGTLPVLVGSNHNNHFNQYIEKTLRLGHDDPKNMLKTWEWQGILLKEIDRLKEEKDNTDFLDMKVPNLLKLIVEDRFKDNVKVLDVGESHIVNSFETSIHGHEGISGARTLGQLQNHINTKVISAHTHAVKRTDGHLVIGTSSRLDRNYTTSQLSKWSHAHAIVFKNDKAQQIIQNSKTGNFRIEEKANSSMILFKNINKKDFEAHFSSDVNDMIAIENGMKYKITTPDNEVIYTSGRKHMLTVTELTEWQFRMLTEKGDYLGHKLENL